MSAIGRINERNPMILELMLKHGLDLEKKEGDSTLIDVIKSFRREEYNRIIEKYVNTGDGTVNTGDGTVNTGDGTVCSDKTPQ